VSLGPQTHPKHRRSTVSRRFSGGFGTGVGLLPPFRSPSTLTNSSKSGNEFGFLVVSRLSIRG